MSAVAVRRGRPSSADLIQLETAAMRAEEAEFAERVRRHVSRIHLAATAERPAIVVATARELAVLADRRLRQLSGDNAA